MAGILISIAIFKSQQGTQSSGNDASFPVEKSMFLAPPVSRDSSAHGISDDSLSVANQSERTRAHISGLSMKYYFINNTCMFDGIYASSKGSGVTVSVKSDI